MFQLLSWVYESVLLKKKVWTTSVLEIVMKKNSYRHVSRTLINRKYTNSLRSFDNNCHFLFIVTQEMGEFDWSPTVQSAILGSFYWCYILSQIVGGVLTQYFGTKTVFGGSQLLTAICSLLMPSAAELHYGAMIALRSIQGIASVSEKIWLFIVNISILVFWTIQK